MITERKKCCGSLFANDIILLVPIESFLKNLLNKTHNWGIKNKMIFEVSKCVIFVVKPKNIIPSGRY